MLIEQVLVNLMKNAAEAMADVKPASVDGVIRVVADIEAGFVDIRVIDRAGVDEATAERLFEPFYSTKSDGMGMGLNICRSIIESHRGRLWVVNNVEPDGRISGATFHCSLPIGEPADLGQGARGIGITYRYGRTMNSPVTTTQETVFVVDDDEARTRCAGCWRRTAIACNASRAPSSSSMPTSLPSRPARSRA